MRNLLDKKIIILLFITLSIISYGQYYNYNLDFVIFLLVLLLINFLSINITSIRAKKFLSKIQQEELKYELLETIKVYNFCKRINQNSESNILIKSLTNKIKKLKGYYKKINDSIYILRYYHWSRLKISDIIFFRKAYIIINLSNNNIDKYKIYQELKFTKSQIFILNIFVKPKHYISKENEIVVVSDCIENNYFWELSFYINTDKKSVNYFYPIIEIPIKSNVLSYNTYSYLKKEGYPIEKLLKIRSNKLGYSRVEGLENILNKLFYNI